MIVFDSSTLILLAKAELLDLFIENYQKKIMISPQVEKETCQQKKTFDALLIQKRIQELKIRVVTPKATIESTTVALDFNLDDGEAESLLLAKEKNCTLATDDQNAIKACHVFHIPALTAMNILLRAHEKKLITNETALAKLEQLTQYGRYSNAIHNDAETRIKNIGG